MHRRQMLAAGVGLIGLAATRAVAGPTLSADNYRLTLSNAERRNGWIEIDAEAFEQNIDSARKLIGNTKICAVMKGDAYGSGIALLMPSILRKGITDIAISSNEEAKVARQLGYRGRLIRVRMGTPGEMEDGFRFGIEELVSNRDAATRLQEMWLKKPGRQRLPVHFALNAGGMSRNGLELSTDYGKAEARAILALRGLSMRGVMTHSPSMDANDILGQLRRYQEELAWLKSHGLTGDRVVRHMANSFVALKHPEARLDMVRLGGALYGDPDYPTDRFLPTMTVKSRVAGVLHYPAGQTVAYNRTYRLERESWLANIPVGYSDGYRRSLGHSNRPEFAAEGLSRTQVLIRGRRFPIVGRVSINTIMVDVTDMRDEIRLDDVVVLLGVQGRERITEDEIATNASAYKFELLPMLGSSLPRVLKVRTATG